MTASPALAEEQPGSSKVNAASHSRHCSTSSTMPISPSRVTRRKKNWEVFSGRNKFYCDGRIIMAKQTEVLIFTLSLIVITVALFFIFDCRLTLVPRIYLGFFIPIFAGLLFLFSLACLFRTAWSDPGIIPKATPEEAAYIEKVLQSEQTRNDGTSGYRPPPRSIDVVINGTTVKLKYCFTCKIFRPPRASHCSMCDNCVENFDHHCPWVGNCVGRRNYRYFYLFVTSLSFLCFYIFGFAIVNIVLLSKDGGFLEALKNSPGSAIEIFICFFSVWSVVGLSGFHSYLICRGVTTNEDIKGMYSKKRSGDKNPFSRGNGCSNCLYILCAPLPPSVIDRRGYATQTRIDEFEAAQARTNRFINNASYGASQAGMHLGGKPYPVMDVESYDTRSAPYPRQPNFQQPQAAMNRNGANDAAIDVADEPDIEASTQASGDNVQIHENVVEYHQSPCYTPISPDISKVESESVSTLPGDHSISTDLNLDELGNASVISTDSSTFLLGKTAKLNGLDQVVGGLKNGKLGTKRPKISAV